MSLPEPVVHVSFGYRRDGRGQATDAATVQPNGFQMTGRGSVQHTIPLEEIVVAAVVLVCLGLSYWLEAMGFGQVSWSAFAPAYLCALGLIGIGAGYRISQRSERIAATLMVTGLYVAFTNAGATLNYLLYPEGRDTMDLFLMRIDAWIGFDWITYVFWFEGYDWVSWILLVIYQTSLFQLLAVILFLGFTGRIARLHQFLLIGVITSLVSVLTWSISPSFGPGHFAKIPTELSESLRLNIDTDYLDHLAAIANGAVGVIEPSSLRGLIAFPSMHTVMSLLAVTYTVGTRAFPFLLALNIPMVPAILLHGGHHLVDIIGGTVVFFVVAWLVQGFRVVTPIASRHA